MRLTSPSAAVGAAAVLVLLAGGAYAVLGPGGGRESVETAGPASSTAPSPEPSADESVPPPVPPPSPSAAVSPTSTPSRPATSGTPPTAFPEDVSPRHGQSVSGVYLAVSYVASDPRHAAATAQARAAGYDEVSGGDIDCDQGARRQLRLAPRRDYHRTAVYFADRATAQRFVDAYEPGVVGIADVTTYCLD